MKTFNVTVVYSDGEVSNQVSMFSCGIDQDMDNERDQDYHDFLMALCDFAFCKTDNRDEFEEVADILNDVYFEQVIDNCEIVQYEPNLRSLAFTTSNTGLITDHGIVITLAEI